MSSFDSHPRFFPPSAGGGACDAGSFGSPEAFTRVDVRSPDVATDGTSLGHGVPTGGAAGGKSSFSASRSARSEARRGAGRPHSPSSTAPHPGPLRRSTATAARPAPLASAMIVSVNAQSPEGEARPEALPSDSAQGSP